GHRQSPRQAGRHGRGDEGDRVRRREEAARTWTLCLNASAVLASAVCNATQRTGFEAGRRRDYYRRELRTFPRPRRRGKSWGDRAACTMARMQNLAEAVRAPLARRRVGCAFAALTFALAAGACGSGTSGGGADAGTDAGTDGGSTFHVDISLTTGLVTFPNPYSGWSVGGGSATNFVAYPGGWTVGGGSATNFIAVPPGWTVGGGSATNFVAY